MGHPGFSRRASCCAHCWLKGKQLRSNILDLCKGQLLCIADVHWRLQWSQLPVPLPADQQPYRRCEAGHKQLAVNG